MKTFRQHFTGGIQGCKYVLVNRNSEKRPSPRFVPLSIVVAVSGGAYSGEYIAFALPSTD